MENGTEDLVTTYQVDDRGLVTAETSPLGNATGGDPAAHTTDFAYDVLGRLTESAAPPVTVEEYGTQTAVARPTASTGYNTFGEVTDARDANGEVTHTSYDAAGRPVSTTLPSYTPPGTTTPQTATLRSTYDAAGRPVTETEPLGNVTSYTYDQLGRLTAVTEPAPTEGAEQPVTRYTYDLLGERLSTTDPTGARTEATYDELGRQITSTVIERQPSAGVYTTHLTYDDAGNLTSTTSPTGIVTTTDHNAAGQPTSSTDAAGKTTTYDYGPTGLPVAVTDPLGRTVRSTHDLAGRVTAVTDLAPDGTELRTRSSAYDAVSNPVAVTNPLGHTVQQTFDAHGRLTELVEPVDAETSLTTTFGYDAAGNRTRLTDGRGNVTWYTFTSRGLPESVIEPATAAHPDAADRTFTTVYDAAGQPVRELQPGGVEQTRTFDALGRVVSLTGTGAEAATGTDTFDYDLAGRVTSVSAPGGTNAYTYDDRGNLLSSSGPSGTATFTYDAEGRLAGRTDAAGAATFGYDNAGRLASAADPLTGATQSYTYDALSRPSAISYGSPSATRSFGYDALGRLASDTLKAPDSTTTAEVTYTFDEADQLTGKTTTGTAGAGQHTYAYDQAGRLTNWTAPDATDTSYTWDASGNRVTAGAKTATYDERNRLLTADGVTYSWSARGTLLGTTGGPDGDTTAAYDALGRLLTDGTTTYAYDGLGRLVKRGETTLAYADHSNNAVSTAGELVFRDPAGNPLSTAAPDGSGAQAVLADAHGDVTGTFAPSTGTLAGSSAYSPFGNVTDQAGARGSLGYQGEYTDSDTGKVNMHARWYDPSTGAFASRDSWTLNPTPSIQANRYTYGNGSPLIHTDPSGHRAVPPGGAGWGSLNPYRAPSGGGRGSGPRSGGGSAPRGGTRPPGKVKDRRNHPRSRGLNSTRRTSHRGQANRLQREFRRMDQARTNGRGSRPSTTPTYRCTYNCGGGNSPVGGRVAPSTRALSTGPRASAPPPPPMWSIILPKIIAKAHPRPPSVAVVDFDLERRVEDSFTQAAKDLELTDAELRGFFKVFPILESDEDFREEFESFLISGRGNQGRCHEGSGTSWVHYMPRDSANGGRATGVIACLRDEGIDYKGRGKRLDPDKETEIVGSDTIRSSRVLPSDPAGWQDNDSRRGFQRGHLLARSLGGSGTEPRNLVKLYKKANSPVMRDFEGAVRDRVSAGEAIFYTAIPSYSGRQVIPDRVELFAFGSNGYVGRCTVHNTPTALSVVDGRLDARCSE
ncbi:RHS repeat-associated core domain-containing protein [Streptomyces sp. WMMC1477]|uniref:RHS repeat-associated core domain-containing protein n=1 Tax=Streptomyces sp. WMMC1477 TaxID=3015155 RepID=UPI0022B71CA5|nr:RHS repeat-associated core domain-containing protein [Streptomyces sp. WMMC1477]MCZ7432944.1 DNA/RNA non-specific endonuclease [Streptomyces sp. WMMC1477]